MRGSLDANVAPERQSSWFGGTAVLSSASVPTSLARRLDSLIALRPKLADEKGAVMLALVFVPRPSLP